MYVIWWEDVIFLVFFLLCDFATSLLLKYHRNGSGLKVAVSDVLISEGLAQVQYYFVQ